MDPLSAVSLAATVVQFVDFGFRLVSKSKEIYSSVQGASIRNIELESISQNLVSINNRLQQRSDKTCAFAITDDELALKSLCKECSSLGKELLNALNRAKVQGSHKGWKSVRQALKQVIGADDILEIYQRLARFREQIVIVLLAITSSKQDILINDVKTVNVSVKQAEEKLLLDNRRSRDEILKAIQSAQYDPRNSHDVAVVSQLLSGMVQWTSTQQVIENVLNSLYYPRMTDRHDWISQAHRKTFNWALEGKSTNQGLMEWDDLQHWMKKSSGIYWLTGKAGSGKSTLMKYIQQDQRSYQYLREWSKPLPLVTSSFYFWNPGTSMQKSQLGLLRCLLYEILNKIPDVIDKILPQRWRSMGQSGSSNFTWTTNELHDALKILSEADLDVKFCFFIDGLDEFDGDHQVLVDMFLNMTKSPHVKILASSRPWLVFSDNFSSCPRLMLQDLTRDDIQVFAHDSLYGHSRFMRLLEIEREKAPQLLEEIVEKSAGVFLWVYLVVRSLLEGLTNADRMSDLKRRLEALPADLEQFFMHIMTSLDDFYLHQASQLFRLAIEAAKPLSVLTFSFLDEEEPDFAERREIEPMSVEEESFRCENIERRLNSRCKGLLESRKRQACDAYSTSDGVVGEVIRYEVDFLHRTVRDFLSTPTIQVRLVASDTSSWNANMTLARAFVAQLKALRLATHTESNFQSLWTTVLDAMFHLSRVGDDAVDVNEKVDLLEAMDLAATKYRDAGVIKRRCSADAHWVNTGYRYGFQPSWKCDLLSFTVQYDMQAYVEHQLDILQTTRRQGKPLLGFALTARGDPEDTRSEFEKVGGYEVPRVAMVELLLKYDASPNEVDFGITVWDRFLQSLYRIGTDPLRPKKLGESISDWFEIAKVFLVNGADTRGKIFLPRLSTSLHKRFEQRIGSRRQHELDNAYSSLELVRMVFGGHSSIDLAELEDLIGTNEAKNGHVEEKTSSIDRNTLQVPKTGSRSNNHQRSTSASSATSQISTHSWRRPLPDDTIVGVNTTQSLPPTYESVQTTSSLQVPMSLQMKDSQVKSKSKVSGWIKKFSNR